LILIGRRRSWICWAFLSLSIGQRATLLALKKEAVEGNFKRLARER
jgi:hypothetical protein